MALMNVALFGNRVFADAVNPEYSLEELMLKPKAPILWPRDAKS